MATIKENLTFKQALRDQGMPSFFINPTAADKKVWVVFILITLWESAVTPLRVWFINHVLWFNLLVGSFDAAILAGAHSMYEPIAWIYPLLSVIGALKFVPVFFIMGRLWGREFLMFITSSLPRLQRYIVTQLDTDTTKLRRVAYGLTAVSYVPFMRLSPVLTVPLLVLLRVHPWAIWAVNVTAVLVTNGALFLLGRAFGPTVLEVVDVINSYATWVFWGLIAAVVISASIDSYRKSKIES